VVAGLAADSSIIVPDAKLEGMGIKVIVGEVTDVNAADKKTSAERSKHLGLQQTVSCNRSEFLCSSHRRARP
jgi:hypothetical protein